MPSFDVMLSLAIFITILPLVGILTAITPWLMKKRECFAVTVPEIAQDDPRLARFKQRYAAIILCVTFVGTVVTVAFLLSGNQANLLASFMVSLFVLIGASFALMLYFRSRVQQIKKQEGWTASADLQTAVVAEADFPKPLSLAWDLLYIPVMLITLLIGVVGYPSLPDLVPIHSDMYGNVNDWMEKSPLVILFPVLIQAFLGFCIVFSHWIILRSKCSVDPEAPVSSALAYGLFARAQSTFLVVAGLALSLAIGVVIQLSMLAIISMSQAMSMMFVVIVPVLIGAVVIALVYGQSGARALKRMKMANGLLADDDAFWKLGVFYCNAKDPSLFVPERFGVGWTCNFARPAIWGIIAAFLVVTAIFVVGITMLM